MSATFGSVFHLIIIKQFNIALFLLLFFYSASPWENTGPPGKFGLEPPLSLSLVVVYEHIVGRLSCFKGLGNMKQSWWLLGTKYLYLMNKYIFNQNFILAKYESLLTFVLFTWKYKKKRKLCKEIIHTITLNKTSNSFCFIFHSSGIILFLLKTKEKCESIVIPKEEDGHLIWMRQLCQTWLPWQHDRTTLAISVSKPPLPALH